MRFLRKVNLTGIRPELITGLIVFDGIYESLGHELIVTSVIDGNHSEKSLHYTGTAADCRTKHLESGIAESIVEKARKALTKDFDVVLEATHIHLEFQPKRS